MVQIVIEETIKLKQLWMEMYIDHIATDDRNILVYLPKSSAFRYSDLTQSRYIIEKTIEVNYG
jgi:hypothetical protein